MMVYLNGRPVDVGSKWNWSKWYKTPEANIFAPENGGPLEKEIPIGNHHFQVPR